MFTGLISEIGIVRRRVSAGKSGQLTIAAPQTAARLNPGDSVAIAGACLTVETVAAGEFTCAVIAETLATTRLGKLRPGDPVNLELPVGPDDVFGGHIVAGHVDTIGRVVGIRNVADGRRIRISFPRAFDKWVVEKGSIAIDGISLTVAELRPGEVSIGVIPTTWEETTIGKTKPGDQVNIEFDQAIKAAVKAATPVARKSHLTEEALRRAGW